MINREIIYDPNVDANRRRYVVKNNDIAGIFLFFNLYIKIKNLKKVPLPTYFYIHKDPKYITYHKYLVTPPFTIFNYASKYYNNF